MVTWLLTPMVLFVLMTSSSKLLGVSGTVSVDQLDKLLDKLIEREEEKEAAQLLQENKVYEKRDDVFVDKRWHDEYYHDVYKRYGADMLFDKREAKMNSLTNLQTEVITFLHNKLRRQEGASNMETLYYNPQLAALAQTWSQRCVFEHGQPPFSASTVGYSTLGQNIFAHESPTFKVEDAVNAWYNEKADYNYDTLTCNPGKVCGHYTAVTWAKTTDVGCGITFCPSISGLTNAHFIVCNYAPPGNFGGEKPFLKGPPCTQCDSGKFFCNYKLCDKSCTKTGPKCNCRAACKRCAQTDRQACKCNCRPGSMGPDCSAVCADGDPKCGANPGYPAMLCTMNDPNWAFVKTTCPKMCGLCAPPDGTPCNSGRGGEEEEEEEDRRAVVKRLMLNYLGQELNDNYK